MHDQISQIQKELIELQDKIDKSLNDRTLVPIERQFESKKMELDKLLAELFQLKEEDKSIPLISEVYAAN